MQTVLALFRFTLLGGLLFFLWLPAPTLWAQAELPPQDTPTAGKAKKEKEPAEAASSAVVIYPFAFIRSSFQLGYHQRVGERSTVQAILGIAAAEDRELYGWSINSFLGVRGELQYRLFLNNVTMNGIYIGGYGQFKHLQADGEFEEYDQIQQRYFTVNETRQAQGISGGILFGYQVTKNWFTADIFVGGGPQYSWGQYRNLSIPLLDFYTRGMIMNAGFSLGMKIK